MCCVFFFKQKTAYELRISDWSSDVCSSDLFNWSSRNNRRVANRLVAVSIKPMCHQVSRSAAPSGTRVSSTMPASMDRTALTQPTASTTPDHAPENRQSVQQGNRVQVRVDLSGSLYIQTKIVSHTIKK